MNGRQALRRYPALGFLGAAAALALLLPSRLTTPRTGPSTLAEYAPVPGQSTGAGEQTLGEASSGALGFGRGAGTGGGGAPAPTPLGGPGQPRPRTKRCVGSPPRQTEDPLSPPCVAYFEGDNGGATTRGVTRDEVRVVVLTSNAADQQAEQVTDCDASRTPVDTPMVAACRAFSSFFNERYQTYGRHVHLWVYVLKAAAFTGSSTVIELEQRFDPFAVVLAGANQSYASEAASRRIFAVSYDSVDRVAYQRVAPYRISFRPDQEDAYAIVAGYVCTKLAGRPARLEGQGVGGRPRAFGLWFESAGNADRLQDVLRATCGLGVAARADLTRANSPTEAARLQAGGVTTVIVEGGPGNVVQATNTATTQGYFPEWVLSYHPSFGGMDTNGRGRQANQVQWRQAFGVTFDYRRDAVPSQFWHQAYLEGCSGCPEPTDSSVPAFYDTLTMLFYGIQAAGPRLTPANLDRGLHAIPQQGSPSPYKPAAYFAPGNYTFVKDGASVWWDPGGQAPGDPTPGCWRLSYDGRRRRANEWDPGDEDIGRPGVACQGSMVVGS